MCMWKLIVGFSMAKCSTKSSKTSTLAIDASDMRRPTKRLVCLVSLACVSRTALETMASTGMGTGTSPRGVDRMEATSQEAGVRGQAEGPSGRADKGDADEPGGAGIVRVGETDRGTKVDV